MKIKITMQEETTRMTREQERELLRLPRRAYRRFVEVTPVDTGRARRRTRLRGDTIVADYDYAQRLDEGASRQAPRGMVEPVIEYVEQEIERIVGRN